MRRKPKDEFECLRIIAEAQDEQARLLNQDDRVGDLASLKTSTKTNVVDAINELYDKIENL